MFSGHAIETDCWIVAGGAVKLVLADRSEVTRMLTTQYRKNMSWSSRTLYSDQLTAAPSVSNHLLSGLPNTVLLLMDTAGLRGRGSLAEGSS